MTIHTPLPAVKPNRADSSGERDFLLTSLRYAAAQSRLITNSFDSIGVALRQKQIDCAGALAWLKEEDLLDWLPLGPEAMGPST